MRFFLYLLISVRRSGIHFAHLAFWILCVGFSLSLPAQSKTKLGIDYLEDRNFDILKGKRVGLLTHPAGVNSKGKSTVLVLHTASEVRLSALFGPEHGIYGDEEGRYQLMIKLIIGPIPVYSLW